MPVEILITFALIALAILVLVSGTARKSRPRKGTHRTPAFQREVPDRISGAAFITDRDGLKVDGHVIRMAGLDAPEHDQPARESSGIAPDAALQDHTVTFPMNRDAENGAGNRIAHFVSADWGKTPGKRAVWIADLSNGRIRKADRPSGPWSLDKLLDLAEELAGDGPVLVGIDVALGVPAGYWKLVQEASDRPPRSFVHWLGGLDPDGEFFETALVPDEWRASRPWFRVMAGAGGKISFTGKVSDGMLRRVDAATGAKPVFAVSGMPGTVGSGTRAFWKELVPRLSGDRNFRIWPFEGDLESLTTAREVVLSETYPALAYAAALADRLPTDRIGNAKTRPEWRHDMCGRLERAAWIRVHGIDLGSLDPARENEDDFDACFTAAAVLRCLLEGMPLAGPEWTDHQAEGSMLLTGAVSPDRPASGPTRGTGVSSRRKAPRDTDPSSEKPHAGRETDTGNQPVFPCPIPGCKKMFVGSRGGWDGHVSSPRMHPDWLPEITEPEQRRQTFRREFGDWFR